MLNPTTTGELRMRNWLCLFNCGNAADVVSTFYGLALGGHEANPLIAWAIAHWGFFPTAAAKLAWGLLASVLLYKRSSPLTIKCLTALIWLVVTNNICHIAWRFYGFLQVGM